MNRTSLREILADKDGITKSELIHFLAGRTGLTKVETETVIDGLLSTVEETLIAGKKVELRGFGTFLVRIREPREARNPATQETVMLDRRKVPVFRPSKALKMLVDNSAS